MDNKQAVELAWAGLALLDGTGGESRKNHRKKAKAKAKEAEAKIPKTKAKSK